MSGQTQLGTFMSTKIATKRSKSASGSRRSSTTSASEKAKRMKVSIRAAYDITKKLESVREVKPESLLQPMTL
jgi:hypothetical protein